MFVGNFTPHNIQLVTVEGTSNQTKMVGALRVVFADNNRVSHDHGIPEVVYNPKLPHNLLGIPLLAKHFAAPHKKHAKGTWIRSGAEGSTLTWDHGKHEHDFQHSVSKLPKIYVNEGTTYFTSFCT